MRQLTFVEPGKLEWREVPEPKLGADVEAIVRPLTVATCDLDLALVRGKAPAGREFAFGHEDVAEVVEVGDDVGTVAPGMLVSVPFQISCGQCARCVKGRPETASRSSSSPATACRWDRTTAAWSAISLGCRSPTRCWSRCPRGSSRLRWRACPTTSRTPGAPSGPQLEAEPGRPVLVCAGAGSIALYAAGIAVALGAERVDFAGGRRFERELAERLGATLLDEDFPKRLGPYPITVDASSNPDGLRCALRSTEADGICTSIGIYFEPKTAVPLLEMYTKGIRFHTGRVHARPAMEPILDFVRAGTFQPELVTRETAGWEDAAEAVAGHSAKLVISR